MAEVCLALAALALIAYVVLGGADYGTGFWDLVAGGARRGGPLRGLVMSSMTPVWEANHVWLPFLLVILWTAFPVFFASIMSTLWIPLLIATAGIIFRGTAFVLRGYAVTVREGRALGGMFALSSILVPFALAAAVGGIASGRVPVGNALGDPFDSWLNPTSIALGLVGVASGAFLAAVFLTADARRLGLDDLLRGLRVRAAASGVVTGALALGSLLVVRSDAPQLWSGLTSGGGLACVLASGAAGLGTVALVLRGRYEAARYAAGAAVAFVVLGWVVAQSPFLLPGELTLAEAAAPQATLTALVVALAVGAVFLVPSLVLLYRLFLQGKVAKPYQPLDESLRDGGRR